MKIERRSWYKEYVVDIPKIFCNLVLMRVVNEASGPERKKLMHYREAFQKRCKKVLVVGPPGIGKTYFVKKMVYDWSDKSFDNYALVLYVKLVKDTDVEKDLIEQNKWILDELGFSEDEFRKLLRRCGERCLIILDDHVVGSKYNIMNAVEDVQKMFRCSILLTCRPHKARLYEKHFDFLIAVEGFRQPDAEIFARKFLKKAPEAESIVKFVLSGTNGGTLSPMLLSIMCTIMNEKEKEELSRGDFYFRIIRYLYLNFTVRKGEKFSFEDLTYMLRCIGQLAWECKSSDGFMEYSYIESIAGEYVFDCGLIIGNKDLRIVNNKVCDVEVSFLDKNMKEFFEAFYFVCRLSEGEVLDQCVLSQIENPDRSCPENQMFTEFCRWLLARQKCPCLTQETGNQIQNKTRCQILFQQRSHQLNLGKMFSASPKPQNSVRCCDQRENKKRSVRRLQKLRRYLENKAVSKPGLSRRFEITCVIL